MIILIVTELLIDFLGGILVIILSRFMIIERNLNFIWVRYTFVQTFIV